MASSQNHPPVSRYYVVARVVGSEGSFPSWRERLVHLCGVSSTEEKGTSYHWARSLGSDTNTLWGLEGYTDASGFFDGHPASDVFKEQMAIVDSEKLLAQDYDLRYYWSTGGFLRRAGEGTGEGGEAAGKKAGVDGVVSVVHFTIKDGQDREKGVAGLDEVSAALNKVADKAQKDDKTVRSFLVLKEVGGPKNWDGLVTAWIRTTTAEDFAKFQATSPYKEVVEGLKAKGVITKEAVHQSEWFNGHIDKTPKVEQ